MMIIILTFWTLHYQFSLGQNAIKSVVAEVSTGSVTRLSLGFKPSSTSEELLVLGQ